MASNNRAYNSSRASGDHAARSLDPQQPVIAVLPLNSVPYTSTPRPHMNSSASQTNVFSTSIINHPAMVFLPSQSNEGHLERVLGATSHGVAVTGSAALGKVGHPIGSIDISESNDTYLFRVALPGVARDSNTFSWFVEPNGKIFIKGITTTGEKKVLKHGMVFEMLTQNLCPPGEFSISFQLPGPIDSEGVHAVFGTDGMFEGVVKKMQPQTVY
ncbi:alpha-crystallin domain-containing protein 22.3 [Apium graveolens]|uniref:alpha-crystallin domain-containing protein 22.3 n=1 Tax=Apium graveolens TaxID=4045 RepID=UPI003D7BBFB3